MKHKLKHFLWSCLNRTLPLDAEIFQRTGVGDPLCKYCGEDLESVEHVLLLCKQAKEVWMISPFQWDGLAELRYDFWKWLLQAVTG